MMDPILIIYQDMERSMLFKKEKVRLDAEGEVPTHISASSSSIGLLYQVVCSWQIQYIYYIHSKAS